MRSRSLPPVGFPRGQHFSCHEIGNERYVLHFFDAIFALLGAPSASFPYYFLKGSYLHSRPGNPIPISLITFISMPSFTTGIYKSIDTCNSAVQPQMCTIPWRRLRTLTSLHQAVLVDDENVYWQWFLYSCESKMHVICYL